jgi:hypothetical protein
VKKSGRIRQEAFHAGVDCRLLEVVTILGSDLSSNIPSSLVQRLHLRGAIILFQTSSQPKVKLRFPCFKIKFSKPFLVMKMIEVSSLGENKSPPSAPGRKVSEVILNAK